MINLIKLNRKSVSPPLPPTPCLRRAAPAPYFHPLFMIFQFPPPPRKVIKILTPLLLWMRGGGERGLNYDQLYIFFYVSSGI